MDYNYHTHTYLCSHASGSIEEYVKRAIDGGIKRLGFSEHMPFVGADGQQTRYRIPTEMVGHYFDELSRLRERYENDIEILIGFEMEYYPLDFERMLKSAIEYGAEYLILGQHFTYDERLGSMHTMKPIESVEYFKEYVDTVIEGIKSGVFSYVAHPDVINFIGDQEVYKKEMRRICVAAREYDIPLEINFLGIRGNRNYPNDVFWEIAGQEKVPVTFGFDAHDVPSAYDEASIKRAMEIVIKHGLNYIGEPKIILLQQKQHT